MAKTNSYKKVIAGTMTAAMVAGVVSPVAAAVNHSQTFQLDIGQKILLTT